MLRDCKKLATTYIKSFQFKLDIATFIPLEIVLLITGYRPICRLNRLLKIDRLFETRLKIETRSSRPFLFRIMYLVLLMIILIHWNACFYFVISKQIGADSDEWVFNYPEQKTNIFLYEYLTCFYWSILMLTTIGEVNSPVNNEESLVMICNFLIAIVLVATLVGNIGSVISNMNIEQDKFQEKVDGIKSLMSLRRVSKELDTRVVKWLGYFHKNNQNWDEDEILFSLPDKLRVEISSNVYLETLKKVHIFAECEEGLLKELVTKLKVQVYSPGDFVCRKGDIGKEMYIIKRGNLNVVSDDGKVVFVTLKAGAFFGEISILNIPGIKSGNRRTANVQSVGYSDLIRLTKNDLWEALADYPENTKLLIEKGKAKLIKDNLLDENYKHQGEYDKKTALDKFEKIEKQFTGLEKRVEASLAEFGGLTETLKKKMKNVRMLYDKKLGTNV